MPYTCEYCNYSFTTLKNLKRHQKTKISCLDIQKSKGIQIEREEYKCDKCDRVFTQRCKLKSHQIKEHITISSETTNINIISNNTNTVNITLNFGETFSDITKERVMAILEECLNKIPAHSVEQGIGSMTEKIAPFLLRNGNGNWISRVADASRNKLAIRTKNGEEPDIDGRKTSELLRDPIRKVGNIAFHEAENKEDVINTLNEIEDDGVYGKKSTAALMRILPNEFERGDYLSDDSQTSEKSLSERNKALVRRYREKQLKIKENEKKITLDNFLKKTIQCHDGTGAYWNTEHCYVVLPDSSGKISIVGRKNKLSDSLSELTKADIKKIHDMQLDELLAPKYKDFSV